MLPRGLRYALVGCLLHASFTSARGVIIIPIVIDGASVFTATFSFLIIFSIFTGFLFLASLGKVFGSKEEVPPDVSPIKYDVGRVYPWLSFLAVSLWWAQLITYTVYVKNVLMNSPSTPFPVSAYTARFTLDQFTDLFMAAGALYLVHYRRTIHASTVAPSSAAKKAFDIAFLVVQLGIICYTTAFLSISLNDDSIDNEDSYLNWLTSYYVYTAVYTLMAVNVTVTFVLSKKALKRNFIKDEPWAHASAVPGSMIAHAIFKIIIAAVYSQFENPKIDYDGLRLFEVIALGFTYLLAQLGLVLAGSRNKEDDQRMKEIKRLEQEAAKGGHNHESK
ncbi:hypothetical protein NP233_g6308 [Leucocoprinus birnbaumii]|uniref:Uncharacterized protein n=1 Tax=Leucocoprinus birnbaumii TaxID=56174 RepID=A0AAD5YVN3_9AGAR|nr:hypothetical protein NP233_g6308 [Leucocoprinus birnbaumii]